MTRRNASERKMFMSPAHQFELNWFRDHCPQMKSENYFGYKMSVQGFFENTLFMKTTTTQNINLEKKDKGDVFVFKYKKNRNLLIVTK